MKLEKNELMEMAEEMGIGKCPKCGIVSHNPKGHCDEVEK